jgi:hypothetical protein
MVLVLVDQRKTPVLSDFAQEVMHASVSLNQQIRSRRA